MSPRPPDHRRRLFRRLAPAALLMLAPKCLLCLAAYAGLGAVLGLGGPELCGAPVHGAWWLWLPFLGVALGITGFFACRRDRGGMGILSMLTGGPTGKMPVSHPAPLPRSPARKRRDGSPATTPRHAFGGGGKCAAWLA